MTFVCRGLAWRRKPARRADKASAMPLDGFLRQLHARTLRANVGMHFNPFFWNVAEGHLRRESKFSSGQQDSESSALAPPAS